MVRWPRSAHSFRAGCDVLERRMILRREEKSETVFAQCERAASAGVKSTLMPSASTTSALPTGEVTARLPCLATVTPAAAHRMATVVEMLNVLKRSPPVPTTSRISRASRQVGINRRRNGFVTQGTGERGDFVRRFAFLRQRGQKVGFDGRRNFFISQLFHGLTNLPVRERIASAASCWSEFFKHGLILRTGNGWLKAESAPSR